MASGVQDFNRTEFDRLNEIKGHLEIALLEKHFLREYRAGGPGDAGRPAGVQPGCSRPLSPGRWWEQAWPQVDVPAWPSAS